MKIPYLVAIWLVNQEVRVWESLQYFIIGLVSHLVVTKPEQTPSLLRLSLRPRLVAHQTRAYPGFLSMRWLGAKFLLLPGWDAISFQGYPPPPHHLICKPRWREGPLTEHESNMTCLRAKCSAQARAGTQPA